MKKLIQTLPVLMVATLFATQSTTPVHAQDQPAPAITESVVKPKQMPFRGKLKAIDQKASTITLPGREKDRVFHVIKETKIMKAGKPATLKDAMEGEEVGGLAREAADGKLELVSLRIGPKPEPEEKPARRTEPEKSDT